ncbi:MAG: lytic transglycosylase domain-containing protein [Deferrisomatales bacterium]|nr:lytic transglycosylase domain-containing protein [Deferrisomatales bacterium]
MAERRRTAGLLLGTLLAAAGVARADVYRAAGADGSISFTDTPTEPGYAVVIQETPPVLPWRQVVGREAERYGLDPRLVRAVIYVESGEDPVAVSPKGAQGLMQLMPGTAAEVGVDHPLRPRDNIRGGVGYLATLVHDFDGDLELALAAYNAGPGAVRKYGGIPPYRETQNYVKKVLDVYRRQGD